MAPPTYTVIDNSTFLDFTGYRVSDAKTVAKAYDFNDGVALQGRCQSN